MPGTDKKYFDLLKLKITAVMQQSYPGMNPLIAEWKGQEIVDFQEDLRIKVHANISEKWFYTHFKSSKESLPRIDMLNFLSQYAGYANWDDFIFRNREVLPDRSVPLESKPENSNRYFIIVPLLTFIILALFYGLFKMFNTQEYQFSFMDANTHEAITDPKTEITLLPENESPIHYMIEKDGSIRLKTDHGKVRLAISAPYYQSDTVVRILTKFGHKEVCMLKPDDYALMLHYFSTMKVEDWEDRRTQLNAIIDDGAMIFQVIGGSEATGMALYNKQEFIDRLSTPSGSLKNIEILDSKFTDGKLKLLRFRVNKEKG